MTRELITSVVDARLKNIRSEKVDLLQFHWQDVGFFAFNIAETCYLFYELTLPLQYEDKQYIQVAKWLLEDPRVTALGLCNFDTERVQEFVDNGVNISTNQVQVFLPSSIAGTKSRSNDRDSFL